jgi:hypothetical protein
MLPGPYDADGPREPIMARGSHLPTAFLKAGTVGGAQRGREALRHVVRRQVGHALDGDEACTAGLGGEHISTLTSENIQPRGQCEWLEAELSAPEARKVILTHIPTEREGADREWHLGRNDSRWLNDLVRRARPEAVFFGHLHQPTASYRLGDTRAWQVLSCCWNSSAAPVGFLHVRMGPSRLSVREIITGTPGHAPPEGDRRAPARVPAPHAG